MMICSANPAPLGASLMLLIAIAPAGYRCNNMVDALQLQLAGRPMNSIRALPRCNPCASSLCRGAPIAGSWIGPSPTRGACLFSSKGDATDEFEDTGRKEDGIPSGSALEPSTESEGGDSNSSSSKREMLKFASPHWGYTSRTPSFPTSTTPSWDGRSERWGSRHCRRRRCASTRPCTSSRS